MAVRIRLARYGRTHRPYYRVVAIDSREHREGKACEILGTYDPLLVDKNISVDIDRVHAWIKQGARLNNSVESLLNKFGYEAYPSEVTAAREAQKAKKKAKFAKRQKKDGAKWVAASRRAVKKHQAKLKAGRLAELNKQLEAHNAAKAAAEAEAAPEEGGDENAEG